MKQEDLREHYRQNRKEQQIRIRQESRIMNLLSLVRLLALVATVWLIVPAVRDGQVLYYGAAGLMLILFLFLVKRFLHHRELREVHKRLDKLNEQELRCLEHDFRDFPGGEQFSDPSHAWSHDLDLFGRGSLFQYLNRCGTRGGRKHLAGLLSTEPTGPEEVLQRQSVVDELRGKEAFRQMCTARGSMFAEGEEDLEDIRRWLERDAYITRRPWLLHAALVMSALALFLITRAIIVPGSWQPLLILLAVNFTLLGPFLNRTNRYQQGISKKYNLLQGYAILLRLISREEFTHPALVQNRERAARGMKEVRKLSRLLNTFDWRLNMLLGALLNGFFLFDFILLHLLESWKRRNSGEIMSWIALCGQTDAMNSLGGFARNHPGFARPVLDKGEMHPRFCDLGHPLIPPGRRVDNTLVLEGEKVVLITGANMAGKSTFLRALGVNMVLAYAGCPVCASEYRMRFSGLFTSMRTSDSLADDESYFLAEIKRLQKGVLRMEEGHPLLILLDEVLKGTNTTDKRKGSEGLIRRALPYPVRCFIATHDLGLGGMEAAHPGEVVNYCFESYVGDMELRFDYNIRRGLATNMNASFLMRQMGIME